MKKIGTTVCFSGHRPQNLPFGFNENDPRCSALKRKLKEVILSEITTDSATHFISGMALGIDIFAFEILLDLKSLYPDITLECAIPCENQAVKWREADRNRYFDIIAQCDKETLLQKAYTSDCMQKRNRYMVDKADTLIAVWNGTPSGTGSTVRYAGQQGKKVIIINPNE